MLKRLRDGVMVRKGRVFI